MLQNIDASIRVVNILDSVKQAVDYLSLNQDFDLIFLDIHLADGLSFEIFDQIKINVPIIFTTAYNQYALKAFKVNSIDYLLKPIDEEELSQSLEQFKTQNQNEGLVNDQVTGLLNLIKEQNKTYKTTYLVKHRDQLIPLTTANIAFLYMDMGIVKAMTFEKQVYVLDRKLEDLENELDPNLFYRVNRQYIIRRTAITNMKKYYGGKLIVNVIPAFEEHIVVSKAKSPNFKKWMES